MTKFNPDDYIHLPTLGLSEDELRSLEACKEIEAVADQFESPLPLTEKEAAAQDRFIERAVELMSTQPPPDRIETRKALRQEFKDDPHIRDVWELARIAIPFGDIRMQPPWSDTTIMAARLVNDEDPDPVLLSKFMSNALVVLHRAGPHPWHRWDNIKCDWDGREDPEEGLSKIRQAYERHGGDLFFEDEKS